MDTLWQEEEYEQMSRWELLTEKAIDIEKTISVTEQESERHEFNPTMSYEILCWNRRSDGIVISKTHPLLYILRLKRSCDRNEDFLGAKADEANEQYKSIIEALKMAAPE